MSSVSPFDSQPRAARSSSFSSSASPRMIDPRVLDESVDNLDRVAKITHVESNFGSTEYWFRPSTLRAFDLPLARRDFRATQRVLDRNKIFTDTDSGVSTLSSGHARKLALDAPHLQEQLKQTLFDLKLEGVSLSEEESATFTTAVRAFVQSAYEDVMVRQTSRGNERDRLVRLLPSERRALDNGASAVLNTAALEKQLFQRPRRASDSKTAAWACLTFGISLPFMEAAAKPQPTSMPKHVFFPQVVSSRDDSALLVQCMKEVGYLSHGRKRALSNPEALDAAFALAADNNLFLTGDQRSVARDMCAWFEAQQPRARAQEEQQRNWVTRFFT